MSLDKKKAKAKELQAAVNDLFSQKFELEQEIKQEEEQAFLATGVIGTMLWKFDMGKTDFKRNDYRIFLYVSAGGVPDEYYDFLADRGAIETEGITLGYDTGAYAYGEVTDVVAFAKKYHIKGVFGLMALINEQAERLLKLKQLYCLFKGIDIKDVNWPES